MTWAVEFSETERRGPSSFWRGWAHGPRRRRGARAFSLVEVLLAGVLLAAFGGVLASAVGQAADARARAIHDRSAAQALDEVLTRVDLLGPRRLEREGPTSGEIAVGSDGWSWELAITQRPASDLFEVAATVRPATQRGGPARTAHTLIFDVEGWRTADYQWSDLDPS